MREIRTLRCDVEGTGNVAWSRYCDTRRRKSELTVNTNFDLNRRASPRPYLREAGGAIPSAYSPNLRKTAPQRRFMPKLPIRHPQVAQFLGDIGIEAMINLTGVDQVFALATPEIDAIPFSAIKSEAGDGQRLALDAGHLHPFPASTCRIMAIAKLGDDTF